LIFDIEIAHSFLFTESVNDLRTERGNAISSTHFNFLQKIPRIFNITLRIIKIKLGISAHHSREEKAFPITM
jgi:hypothetical protein